MHRLIKGIWTEEKVPIDWKTNIIVPIYKNKGDKLQCANHIGISLLCTGYKILTTVIKNRLKKYTEHIIGEYQAGFRSGNQQQIKFSRLKIYWKKLGRTMWKTIRFSLTSREQMTAFEETSYMQ